jgi:hypothetical protein
VLHLERVEIEMELRADKNRFALSPAGWRLAD